MDILDFIERGKVKRFFHTRNKLSFKGAIYHTTQRAPGKELLFVEDSDYLYMLHLMKEWIKKFDLDVLSFALMSNHVHILIKLGEANLSLAMKNLFERYADYFNKKYERKGPVFCKPYRAALCLDESYLLAASVYIHLNPVRAGLVQDPAEYRWSSFSLFTTDKNVETFVNYRYILEILDKDIKVARRLYKKLVFDARFIQMKDVLENPRALEIFRNDIFKYVKNIFREEKRKNFAVVNILDEEILEQKISELKKKQRLRKPQEIQARKFLIEQLRSRGYKVEEIAQRLKISKRSIYNALTSQISVA